MAIGIPGSTRDAFADAAKLAKRLIPLQQKLSRLVQTISTTTETSSVFWSGVQRDINRVYEDLRKLTAKVMLADIPDYYKDSLNKNIQKTKTSLYAPKIIHYKDFVKSNSAVQSLTSLLEEANLAFTTGYTQGRRDLIRLARYTQQLNVQEKAINKSIAAGYLETGSPQGAYKNLRNTLLAKMKNDQFVTIIDKNGDTRRYGVDTYAELVTRTKLIEATTQGVVDTTLATGGDLVQVTSHNTNCEVCGPFEGKIFSLSGADKDFPAAYDLPPFHPQCKHDVTTVYREALEVDGTLDAFSEFSNDTTGTLPHPTRKGHVPFSNRERETNKNESE